MTSGSKTRKWILIGLAGLIAVRLYFVRAMLAALLLFGVVFMVFAAIALALYLLDWAGQWSLRWAAKHARPALEQARRDWPRVRVSSAKLLAIKDHSVSGQQVAVSQAQVSVAHAEDSRAAT